MKKRVTATGSRPASRRAGLGMRTALTTWFADGSALARFRRLALGRRSVVLAPRDAAWSAIVPSFEQCVALAATGLPFQVVAERQHDVAPDAARFPAALASGATVLLPQAHQILPRVARLIVALRAALLGPDRDESSYLFLVEGRGREGMGMHHDGEVDGVWLQLEGERTVTIGPPVTSGVPEELGDMPGAGRGWRTLTLTAGTLAYFPPRTPHRVVCHGRSLALTLTWGRPVARRPRPESLTRWDVASGRAEPWPPERDAHCLWTQVPAVAGAIDRRRRRFPLATAEGVHWLPAGARPLAARLASMPIFTCDALGSHARALDALMDAGLVADEELPLVIRPDDPTTLDGWRFS